MHNDDEFGVQQRPNTRSWTSWRLDLSRDWALVLVIGLLIVIQPTLHDLRIDFLESIPGMVSRYLGVGVQGAAFAVLLAFLQSSRETRLTVFRRYTESPAKLMVGVALAFIVFTFHQSWVGVLFILITIATLELYAQKFPFARFMQVIAPATLLFLLLVLVFALNAIAVTVRFEPNYDHVLQAVDEVLLFGHTVSGLAHEFAAAVPQWLLMILVVVYFALFAQIGGTLIFCSVADGRRCGMQFVSTLVIAYLVSVVIFFVFPSHSPYFNDPLHAASSLPPELVQQQLLVVAFAQARAAGAEIALGTEYYIAFPTMHIAQPLVILWFLRRRRVIFNFLVGFDLVLVASIVLLEWHYVIDLFGGVLVAAGAIAMSEYISRRWPVRRARSH